MEGDDEFQFSLAISYGHVLHQKQKTVVMTFRRTLFSMFCSIVWNEISTASTKP